jgi:hypothetical protein
MQQHTGEQVGEDHTHKPREQAEHNELHTEDGGDVVSLRTQSLLEVNTCDLVWKGNCDLENLAGRCSETNAVLAEGQLYD